MPVLQGMAAFCKFPAVEIWPAKQPVAITGIERVKSTGRTLHLQLKELYCPESEVALDLADSRAAGIAIRLLLAIEFRRARPVLGPPICSLPGHATAEAPGSPAEAPACSRRHDGWRVSSSPACSRCLADCSSSPGAVMCHC